MVANVHVDERSAIPLTETATASVVVALENVTQRFGENTVLEDVNLSINQGEFVAILGASGCGKSTLLNLISGLLNPTLGALTVPEDGSAFMFQDATLLPWLSAVRNVELALKLRGVPASQRRDRAEELLALVRLEQAAHRRPHELSGGMRQRVALARSLAQDRPVLLMDEPFAALDAITRDVMHAELSRVWRETGQTIIFVTHNVREAVRLGQRVILFSSRPGTVLRQWRLSEADHGGARSAYLADEMTAALRQEISRHV